MTPNEYQEFTRTTVVYPKDKEVEYLALKLSSEAGEVAGKIAKKLRGDIVTWIDLKSELGDVLWYIARLADHYNISLEDVMKYNQLKLESRKQRGVLKGTGDSR